MALSDPRFTEMYSMAEAIGGICGAKGGILPAAANSTGMHLMGVMPSATGMHARAMLEVPRKAYLLLNIEPELDCQHAALAKAAMAKAECVVALTAFKSQALENADILLADCTIYRNFWHLYEHGRSCAKFCSRDQTAW